MTQLSLSLAAPATVLVRWAVASPTWPVRGGVMRWMPYRAATVATGRNGTRGADLRRVDFSRAGGAVALVFLPTAEVSRG